nr:MAG TPA: Cell wall hydrolase autolysin [Caudoviricetes sp.]
MSKIYINPGHGGTDSGAVGVGGRQEKNDALRYASAVAEKLRAAGHDVKLERDGDYLINVKDIAAKANAWGADYFIAFHRNSGGGTGAECLIVSSASQKSREMAQAIQNALVAVGFKNRGVKVQDKNTYVLSHTTMPATTIECGFIDNAGDNTLFDSKQGEIVQGITDAILSIAGGVAPNPVTPPAPSTNTPELDRVLKRTSPMMTGDDVRQLQERLKAHLADPGKIDGKFGDKTKDAVIAFQQARINEGRDVGCRYNGNKPDGKVGELTWGILWEPAPGE